MRHSFQDSLQEQIISAIDRVCAGHVADDEWIQIDRIVIDVGSFSSHSLYTDFEMVFQRKFEEELEKKLAAISAVKRKNSRQASWLDLFCYFLENGTTPWWVPETEIDFDKISKEIISAQPEVLRQYLYARRFKEPVWIRLAFQLDQKLKSGIVSLFDTLVRAREQFLTWVKRINENNSVAVNSPGLNAEPLIDTILLRNASLIFGITELNEANTLRRLFTDHIEEILFQGKAAPASGITEIIREITMENNLGNGTEKKETKLPVLSNSAEKPIKEDQIVKYAIKDAGIILLAPFLQQIFTKLRFCGKGGWENKQAAWKAAHLLKFMATGEQQQPEYRLVLEKILCGLSLEEPLPREIFLADEEMDEAVSLLHSVLEHWKALRNTSLTGLRESFFKRDGLIKRRDNDWVLQVERKTLDVLLESLPWGYSAVRFPWNDYIIHTEW